MNETNVAIHRTLPNGNQVGYCRNPEGDKFRFVMRANATRPWVEYGPTFGSWSEIADLIDKGTPPGGVVMQP